MITKKGAARIGVATAVALTLAVPATAIAERRAEAARTTASTDTRPNVIVIETDDMRADEMQYLQQTLAALQGTNFTNSYVSTSLCCPSRAAFLSGQYAHNNKVADNNEGARFNNTSTIATQLQSAGYFTSMIGKYLNGYICNKKQPAGWTHWQGLCKAIYAMYGYTINDNGVNVLYKKAPANYQTDVLANRAVATIDEGVASGKPFFMWLTPTAPHGGPGQRPAPRYLTSMANYTLPKPPSFDEADVSDKPAWNRVLPVIAKKKVTALTKGERARILMLLAVDDMVKRIVDEVQAQGIAGNTHIMFTSDNGFMRGEHRVQTGKELLYAESLRVPLLWSGPGIPVGNNPAPVQNTDLAPTILDLAGVTPPARGFDGRSIVPAVSSSSLFAHRAILHRQVGDFTTPRHPGGFGVQADQFIYNELATGEKELYDHRSDPYELQNVVNNPAYAPVVAQMGPMLDVLQRCAAATCQLDRDDLAPVASFTSNCPVRVTQCSFAATASDIDGAVASYTWDFGDGTSATGASPTHAFPTGTTYTVTLTVADDRGVATQVTQSVTAGNPNVAPTASFTTSPNNAVISFDASASGDTDGNIVSYDWDFGDGSSGSGVTTSHDYAATGSFLATLTVTDNEGAVRSISKLVNPALPNQLPTARFSMSRTGNALSLDATTSTDLDGFIVQYTWDFGDGTPPDSGDGTTGTGSVTSHTYSRPGSYTVTLTVTDDRGGTSTLSQVSVG